MYLVNYIARGRKGVSHLTCVDPTVVEKDVVTLCGCNFIPCFLTPTETVKNSLDDPLLGICRRCLKIIQHSTLYRLKQNETPRKTERKPYPAKLRRRREIMKL